MTQLATYNPEQVAALEVQQQVNQLQYLMRQVLKQGEHYGVIPGTKGKPSLLQPGAEKICLMFKLVPRYEVERAELGAGHREYTVTCTLYQRGSETVEGEGMGSCSTLESKYRYRNRWENGQKHREDNPDIADTYNTVLKMARKRALVDAVKSTTAASDIFTQDVEDLPDYMVGGQQATAAQAAPARPEVSDADREWLKSSTGALVGFGYNEREVKAYLWSRYKEGGIEEAQKAFSAMLAAAGAAEDAQQAEMAGDAEAEAIEADEFEAEDIEF